MKTQIDLDEFIPAMDTPEKVYQLFDSLGYKVLDSHLKTNPSVYNLPVKEAALVEKIFAVSNYDRRFQILLFKLKEENKEAIRTIPERILREVDFPFIIFTPDFKTYTFTLVEKVREGPGEFKRKLTKLVIDSAQPYHTDKEILSSLALSTDIKNPVEVYKLFQSAFNVERVTKKFFTEYREVFEKLSKEITKQNKHLKFTLFSREGSVENFTKILLGRLMFLYFIQKRGWLNCFDGWGSGDKKFLYNKFQEAKKDKKNYFKDYLEPLFFDTLNNPRRDKPDQATQFGGRIPFLNGGLFEPEYDYTDVRNHILLENSTFDDVFSVFEKYNFTVKEDEPLEKEVAIDPEMLGKVFENLLEENLRKGKGTYYTPREIVHYMCHESLINYLASEVGIEQEEIRNFLDREQSLEKKETLSPLIRKKAKELDEKLADIKVLDPACGSGAFLVGMLHEVINARLSLNRELGRSFSEYELKKATIQNNIYGVDIDPGASEIAKLRLWLTLVVDHNLSEIEPLPNLDYKIMVGNSLLDEFMGVKLFNFEKARQQTNGKKILKLFEDDIQQVSMFEDDNKANILKALQQLHTLYFKESDPQKKKQIRTQIDKIEFDLIEATVKDEVGKLESQTKQIADKFLYAGVGIPSSEAERISKLSSQQAQILETFNEIKKSNVKPFFLFQLHFSDVFERKGGFDVVIANPPYGADIDRFTGVFARLYPNTTKAFKDIYKIFIELGLSRLLKQKGVLCYIVPNTLLLQPRYKDARAFLLKHRIIEILNLGEEVFEQVVVPTCVIFIRNDDPVDNVVKFGDLANKSVFTGDLIKLERKEIEQNIYKSAPDNIFVESFRELKTDEQFLEEILDFKDAGINYQRVNVGLEQKGKSDLGQRLLYEGAQKDAEDAEYWKGEDIESYFIKRKTGRFVKLATLKNLRSNERVILNKNYFRLTPKLIWRQTAPYLIAVLDEKGIWFGRSIQGGTIKESKRDSFDYKYLLALLNSNYFRHLYSQLVKEEGRVFPQVKLAKLRKLPIRTISILNQKPFIEIVDKIFVITNSSDYLTSSEKQAKVKDYEKQIDELVYKLYGLTPEEIKIVEGSND